MKIRNRLRDLVAEYRSIVAREYALHTPDHRLDEILIEGILFNIALAARPSIIVELGTGRAGSSTRAFHRALKVMRQRGQPGHLYTCDMDPVAIESLPGEGQISGLNMTTDRFAAVWRDQFDKPIDL